MKTATATESAPTVRRGFGNLPCPLCSEQGTVTLTLDDFEGEEACFCGECESTFSLATVRDFIAHWNRVLTWLDTAPALPE